jgi:calcineurin-like phosphoesterase family protein
MIYNPWKIQQVIDDIWYMLHKSNPDKSIDKIGDHWLISDTHFNHLKIQEYCDRPEGWQAIIINNWNRVVKKGDVVLHFGDIGFGDKEQLYGLVKRLHGNIFMIKGNHDRHGKKWYEDVGITVVPSFMVSIDDTDDVVYFTHRRIKDENFTKMNIHGHSHNKRPYIDINDKEGVYVNVSVESIDYTPIRLSDVINDVREHVVDMAKRTSSIPLSAKTLTEKKFDEMRNRIMTVKAKDVLRQVPIYHVKNTPCVDTRKIPDEYRTEFNKWMDHQTAPLIDNTSHYVYSWDWVRWCKMRFDNISTYWD